MESTTRISGGTIVTAEVMARADLLIRDGKIVGWIEPAAETPGVEVIDATGLWVMPGAIDVHTHFEEPDPRMLEGFETGSHAAAAGGITTVIEMPQAHPTSTTAAHVQEKAAIAEEKSIVDMALWGGVILQNDQTEADLLAMADAGVVAYKSFMASSSPFFPAVNNEQLRRAMLVSRDTGLPYGLHAEDNALLQAGISRLKEEGRKDPLAHAESRPPVVETVAVASAVALAEETGAPVHICHVASAGAMRIIADAKARGVRITCETCPQYLVLNTDDLVRLKGFGRCAPALREQEEVERLWTSVLAGEIDILCSDHCGFTVESKQAGEEDIFAVPLGLQGIQNLVASTYSEGVVRRGMNPSRWIAMLTANPARIFGLAPAKGSLEPGADADVMLFDPTAEWEVTVEDHLHRQPWSPYAGKRMLGRVRRTIRRGETLFDDRHAGQARIVAGPGGGKVLRRQAN